MGALALMLAAAAGCAGNEPTGEGEDESESGSEQAGVTWSGEVRAIVEANCTGCHFSGGAPPFTFETYEEVAAASVAMLDAMGGGRMPPWPADPDCRRYQNERVLSDEDLAIFQQWVEEGTPAGDATEPIVVTPEPFEPTDIAAAQSPYTPLLGAAGDDYRCFLLDLEFDTPMWVKGSTVAPGTPAVHHVLVYALSGAQVAQAEESDALEEGEGYTCFGGPLSTGGMTDGTFPNQIAAWVPGALPERLADDVGIEISAGSRVVMQIHYSAVGGAPLPDHSELLLQLSDEPPAKIHRSVPLAIPYIEIPAGEADVNFETTLTNWSAEPATITGLTGHMHLLGTSIGADLVTPAGDTCGMAVPDWDFDWQLNYELREDEPLVVGPGEGLRISCSYDNSPANQPIVDGVQQQPKDVSWGDGSLDEMCLVYASVIEPYAGPSAAEDLGCESADACFAASDGSLSALMACEETSASCAVCAIQAGSTCGLTPCLLGLVSERACLSDCVVATNAFDGSFDACAQATCGDAYAQMLACADPIVQSGSCDEALATCGLTTAQP